MSCPAVLCFFFATFAVLCATKYDAFTTAFCVGSSQNCQVYFPLLLKIYVQITPHILVLFPCVLSR